MIIIDTHTHIYSKEFDADRGDVIRRAKEAGIRAVLLPNEDSTSIESLNRLCDEEPDFAFPMMGLHPTSVGEDYAAELKKIEAALTKRKYIAIGEIGIDLYWDKRYLKQQKEVFEEQLRWSIDMQLPVVIHTRKSLSEALDSIYNVGADKLKGVFHCFSGSVEEWRRISKLPSFLAGIGGVVTFKNCGLSETLKEIPLERIVVETDAPYLAPVPYRGGRNEPVYIVETIKKLSESYKMTSEELAKRCFQNSLEIFGVPIQYTDN
ncbi:MAG: TatD family hydrolase [Tannerella sp.]|jgi:TatD DNase family protein|nr:TatD family hydrolase [Tannerella sp.]